MRTVDGIVIALKLIAGGLFYTSLKTLGQTQLLSISGGFDYFKRCFFLCAVLFVSISLSYVGYLILMLCGYKDKASIDLRAFLRIALPGALDCAGQVCTMLGTMMLPISIVLVLKGSRVVFSALLSKVMLNRRLFAYHWCGVVLCMVGLVIASVSSILNQFNLRSHLAVGICLCLTGEFLRSVRMVSEERLMKTYLYHPVAVIGLEGVVGTILSVPLLLIVDAIPGDDNGSYESWENTVYMLAHSTLATVLVVLLPLWINALYLSGVFVTKMLSAVHNALVTVLTVAVVWGMELIIYYCVDSQYGLGWGKYSVLQLIGFGFILLSTLLYDSTLRIPQWFEYPLNREEAAGTIATNISTAGGSKFEIHQQMSTVCDRQGSFIFMRS